MLISRTINIQNVNIAALGFEMSNLNKVSAINRIDHGTGDVEISVDNTWVAADDTALDQIIASHNATIDHGFIIDDLLPEGTRKRPVNIVNYKTELTKDIFPQRTFDNGLLTQVKYFKDRDVNTGALSGQVLQVDISYVLKNDAAHNAGRTVESRETTRRWNRKDGNLDETEKKVTKKYYPHITESRSEGKRRRDNIFNITSKDLVVLLMFTQTAGDQEAAEVLGLQMAAKYEQEFGNFIRVAAAQLLIDVIVADAEYTWLDNVVPNDPTVQYLVPGATIGEGIRDYLIRCFSGTV